MRRRVVDTFGHGIGPCSVCEKVRICMGKSGYTIWTTTLNKVHQRIWATSSPVRVFYTRVEWMVQVKFQILNVSPSGNWEEPIGVDR